MAEAWRAGRDLLIGVPASFAAGVLVGVLGTFKHQVGVSAVTGTGWPIGLVLAVAMVALLLIALRLAFPIRAYALAAGLGVVLAGLVLLLPGPGGSQVVLSNSAGYVWTAAPAVVTAVVVGWPRRRPRGEPDEADGILANGHDEGRV